ncbi:nuclear fragile X mental retardation-interacting protein 1 [Ostrinia furnacalis]|uniref:nuclear fragile X mental retardation-interacting protein 1 n=1 Tax=Ostrinia furnacalis TaxID=93504 RepID=UPI00103BF58B|nr:nuclear fragile X mental retardation-interacting protein 1 [Ostrinia furnacalis]
MQAAHFRNTHFNQPNYDYPSIQSRLHNGKHLTYNRLERKPLNENYNEEHWCETCDRGFPSIDLLEKHKHQHQKCNIDGCQFIAHPKVITKHIQMQHSTGLYNKIAKLNNPEEIQKWREERKRKYPTKDNIEKKSAEIKAKIERGERMGMKNFNQRRDDSNKNRMPRSGRNQQKDHRQKTFSSNNIHRKSKVPKKDHCVLPTADSLQKLKPFAGIQEIVMEDTSEEIVENINCEFVIDDEDMEKSSVPDVDSQNITDDNKPMVCGALSSLMCNYESSEEETDDCKGPTATNFVQLDKVTGTDKQQSVSSVKLMENIATKLNEPAKENGNKSDDDSGPEETKIDKITETSTTPAQPKMIKCSKAKQNIANNTSRRMLMKPKRKIPSTLLYKLLKREVQQERNIVLQCIRHIVKNNFFDNPNK